MRRICNSDATRIGTHPENAKCRLVPQETYLFNFAVLTGFSRRTRRGFSSQARGLRSIAARASLHLIPIRPVAIGVPAALQHGERNDHVGAGLGTNRQPIRIAVARHELSPGAAPAQMMLTQRRVLVSTQNAHGNSPPSCCQSNLSVELPTAPHTCSDADYSPALLLRGS